MFNSNNIRWAGILYDHSSNFVIRVGATSNDITASGLNAVSINATGGHVNIGANALFAQYGGNVGIGTASPGAKLEVAGQVKITGGTPGAGKVLTSDADGLAVWANVTAPAATSAVNNESAVFKMSLMPN